MLPGHKVLQIVAWGCVAALALASLTPGDEMIRTALPGQFEHLLAYSFATTICMLAYPRCNTWRMASMLVTYAGLLEFAQLFAPGRHSRFSDFAMSSCGILFGVIAGVLLTSLAARRARPQ